MKISAPLVVIIQLCRNSYLQFLRNFICMVGISCEKKIILIVQTYCTPFYITMKLIPLVFFPSHVNTNIAYTLLQPLKNIVLISDSTHQQSALPRRSAFWGAPQSGRLARRASPIFPALPPCSYPFPHLALVPVLLRPPALVLERGSLLQQEWVWVGLCPWLASLLGELRPAERGKKWASAIMCFHL